MIEHLCTYRETKSSGLPWVPEVPAHWEVWRNGRLFRLRKEIGFPDLPVLEVSLRTGVRVRDFENGNRKQQMADRSKYQRALRGDIAYNMMRMWQGALGVVPADGLISPAYVALRPYPEAVASYYAFLFRTAAYMREVDTYSRGIVPDRNRLYWEAFKQMPSVVPPPEEQRLIVRFLAWNWGLAAQAIRTKQTLVKLLVEERQSIVHHCVTRGLDSNIRLKPSGVEWLGDVPEHWSLSRVKNEFLCLNRRRIPLSATQRSTMTMRLYDYYGASGAIDQVDSYLFDDDLLLIAEDGANLVLRNLPLAIIARGKFWVNNHAHILKPRRGNLEYLAHLMESLTYLPWISGAAQPKLTQDRLMSIAIAVPPSSEQDAIARRLEAETEPQTRAISHAKREIELVREYRDRLTADVVTGKMDVRKAAAALPDVTDESDGNAEIDEVEEGDESADDEARAMEAVA